MRVRARSGSNSKPACHHWRLQHSASPLKRQLTACARQPGLLQPHAMPAHSARFPTLPYHYQKLARDSLVCPSHAPHARARQPPHKAGLSQPLLQISQKLEALARDSLGAILAGQGRSMADWKDPAARKAFLRSYGKDKVRCVSVSPKQPPKYQCAVQHGRLMRARAFRAQRRPLRATIAAASCNRACVRLLVEAGSDGSWRAL